jgi:hypothetical protein
MKPVPISQYLDHIGRVAQAEPQAPRRETPVFKPRAVRVVHDPEPRAAPVFSRLAREASNTPRQRPFEPRKERADQDGGWLGREAAPAPEPAPDLEARIAEAYERGLRDGAAAARAEDAETVAREDARRQERAMTERIDFQVNEYGRLADDITNGLAAMEDRIAQSVTRILAPLLTSEMTKQVVDALCADIDRLCAGGAPGLIKIRGSETLLGALRQGVTHLPAEFEFVVEDSAEVTIEAQHTVIRSQLRPWADLIASFVI